MLLCLLWLVGALAGCSDRQRRNPLDPLAGDPRQDLVSPLEAIAGNGQVLLRWDYTRYADLEGLRLYRRRESGSFVPHPDAPLPPATREYVDEQVENGTTYEYRLALLVEGEGERPLAEVERATPGEEAAWVADRFSGLVWKISADGRSGIFARGRFRDLAGLGVDARNGACWVSDRFFRGLYRIGADGELESFPALVQQPGKVAIDGRVGVGWLVDESRRSVVWFPLSATDSLALRAVDASFADPSGLAPQNGACWIADRVQGRALLYTIGGERPAEFRGLERPGPIAAGADGQAWVLVEDGRALLRLDAGGGVLELGLPFAKGVALAADPQEGTCWVLGESGVAVFAASGVLQDQWSGLATRGQGLAFDAVHRHVWLLADELLWKLSPGGETLSRLGGFSGPVQVDVDPGRR